ncbi:hypothetical protein V2J09_011923 [Rumex salicifolius]
MAITKGFVLIAFVISAMASACYAEEKGRHFSDLQETLVVSASPQQGQVLEAGMDKIKVTWGLKAGTQDSTYNTVKVKLCYAPVSQVDRPWRKTVLTNIAKDKTCQFNMFTKPYTSSNTTDTYNVVKEIPGATYFVRVYAYDSDEKEVAYGQTTNGDKTTNLFTVKGITGRSRSIDVASGVFSAFSVVSLAYFFYMEKKKAKRATTT